MFKSVRKMGAQACSHVTSQCGVPSTSLATSQLALAELVWKLHRTARWVCASKVELLSAAKRTSNYSIGGG